MDNNRYITYELHAKEIRRWFVMCMILLVLLVGSVVYIVISKDKQISEYVGYDYMWIVPDDEPAEEIQAYG
jgi:hypothetical protein